MLSWLSANIGTVLITLFLIAVVVLIAVKLRKDKKQGAPSCCGSCAHCAMCGSCCQNENGSARSGVPAKRSPGERLP